MMHIPHLLGIAMLCWHEFQTPEVSVAELLHSLFVDVMLGRTSPLINTRVLLQTSKALFMSLVAIHPQEFFSLFAVKNTNF